MNMEATSVLNISVDQENEISSAIKKVESNAPISNTIQTDTKLKDHSIAISVSEKLDPSSNTMMLKPVSTCGSTVAPCKLTTLKGFEFCHKHILEDKTSPYQYCSYVFREDKRRCNNPAPKLGDQISLCLYHEKQKNKIKKMKSKKTDQQDKSKKTQNTNPQSSKNDRRHSSSDEEYSFFTDSFQVDKIDCTWLGNQASDADSTDSEDENPLNHAGTWTLEECVKICKEKMERLRYLYLQQFKRISYCLREDRRKMLNEYDMDPYTISKVGVPEKSEDPYRDFVEDAHLSNYQKMSGVELLAEKQMKEKKNHTHHGKRSELPRCHNNADGVRCTSRVLPFSKYCHQHICQDQEQFLFDQCVHKDKHQYKCVFPADLFHEYCPLHTTLEPSKSERLLKSIDVAKKAKETKKRKFDPVKLEKKEVEKKTEVVYHNTRRASKNLRSPSSGASSPKIQLLDEMKPSPTSEIRSLERQFAQNIAEQEQSKDTDSLLQQQQLRVSLTESNDNNSSDIDTGSKQVEEQATLLSKNVNEGVSKSIEEEFTDVAVV